MISSSAPGLSRASRAWRLGVVAAGLAVLAYAQLADTNDLFPLGSLSQYGAAKDPNGTVVTFYAEADTTAGRRVRVDLTARGVGVGRSEIESQVAAIRADPAKLQGLADAQRGLHPRAEQFTAVHLVRAQRQLHDGRAVGEASVSTVTSWTVRPPS